MALYHGTSAKSALAIAAQGPKPSKDGSLYLFDASRPESPAGALCFATGDGPRLGSLEPSNFFGAYARANPDFPGGFKGLAFKWALKRIAKAWAKGQMGSSDDPADRCAAIVEFEDSPFQISAARSGFVNEVKIPASALPSMRIKRVHLDSRMLADPAWALLRTDGLDVQPLEEFASKALAVPRSGGVFKAWGQ